ncbi:hypothetical protein [Streptomyces sp. NPDC096013]|uniref:hypothetical protein n=1 Tax=Streptomyces sp. NPDC096013 TaxID=3366069 RepID=UPI003822F8C3
MREHPAPVNLRPLDAAAEVCPMCDAVAEHIQITVDRDDPRLSEPALRAGN